MESTGAIIVSWDFSKGLDKSILLVGKKRPNESVEVINSFQGIEAEELLRRLVSRKEESDGQPE